MRPEEPLDGASCLACENGSEVPICTHFIGMQHHWKGFSAGFCVLQQQKDELTALSHIIVENDEREIEADCGSKKRNLCNLSHEAIVKAVPPNSSFHLSNNKKEKSR